jgi:hypothetical protein
VYDTAVFRYNAQGQVDSMYLKNDSWFNRKITYTGGKISRITRYTGTDAMYYWTVQTDVNGNIVQAEEYWANATGFKKESTYNYSRDNRKNPFENLPPYLFYLDDEYAIFRWWGSNNMINQEYIDHTGTVTAPVVSGYAYKYNANCYPATSQQTIFGSALFPDDDFKFTYQ